ncbi:MAG: flagellar export chaperone FliS [Lautropia sp.]|nr:flagellar export chaperone FliS [Lautropia sp.]
MFTSTFHASASAYHAVDIESAVHMTDPHRLIEMLFDGAIAAVMKASFALKNGDIPARGVATSRAIRIIDEGLKASLDHDVGEISLNLASLYDYMNDTLLQANLHSNAKQYDEVLTLLKELRDAWRAIRPQVVNQKIYG